MTKMITDVPVRCSVCDRQSGHTFLISESPFWPDFGPELDTRPSQWLPGFSIQACPSCRFCAQDISQDIPGAAVIVASPAYREQFESTAYPELADRFLCWGMILEAAGDLARAAWANTFAAWHCDGEAAKSTGCDYESAGSLMTEYRAFLLTWAVILRMATLGRLDLRHRAVWGRYHEVTLRAAELCRCAAVELFRQALDRGQAFAPEAGAEDAIMVDLLRRSGRWEDALSRCRSGLAKDPEPKFEKIFKYQAGLIQGRDIRSHWLFEAMGQPVADILERRAAPRCDP
jgi:hypothetical protein